MKIQIVQIADHGVAYQERLHLRVLESTNLASHLVMSSVWVSTTAVANGNKAVFWFPPQEVKPGDDVILYTRGGAPLAPQPTGTGTAYFYFWGQGNTLWNSPEACALLFDVESWMSTPNPNALAVYMAQLASGLPPQPQQGLPFGHGSAGYYAANPLLSQPTSNLPNIQAGEHALFGPDDPKPIY